jgi:exodeoxyribonuclease VII large subunit
MLYHESLKSVFSRMQNTTIYSVSEINRKVRMLLEDELPQVAVKGEISNFIRANSGHCYFSLKDKQAQIRCACFSPYALQKEVIHAKNGQEILAYGRLSLYEPRGDYQLIVTAIQESGLGLLYQQFIELKAKLEQQGLFAPAHKKPLKKYPEHIAIITSPIGAAYHDIMNTLNRRYPLAKPKLYPSEVQGKFAHLQLIEAITHVEQDQVADLIILARGGGSLEDLWAFNHEDLALAIFNCKIPIITGIGHETDFTIADFVADERASTPSIAAEKATPDQYELIKMIEKYQITLMRWMQNQIKHWQQQLHWLKKPFDQAEKYLFHHWQRLDLNMKQLQEQIGYYYLKKQHHLQILSQRLNLQNPALKIKIKQETLAHLTTLLMRNMENLIKNKTQNLKLLEKNLITLSPKSTLARGYSIVSYQGHVIDKVKDIAIGSQIMIQLAQGKLDAKVEDLHNE